MARPRTGYVTGMSTTPPTIDHRAAQSIVFGHLPIDFDERVLRPRPWTVAQSRWAAELMHDKPGSLRVLELCAGAGHIGLLALALASSPEHHLVAVDLNPAACSYMRRNAEASGMGDQVEVREGPLDDVLAPEERFDVVIADPPWVPHAETARFPDDPLIAIDGGTDGLEIVWLCIRACERHLATGGSAVLQLGSEDQAHSVRAALVSTTSSLRMRDLRTFGRHGVLVRLMAGDG